MVVVRAAVPEVRFTVPRVAPDAENRMLPVGMLPPEADVTLAVSTAGLPKAGVVGEMESAVVVATNEVWLCEAGDPPVQPIDPRKQTEAMITRVVSVRRRRLGSTRNIRPAKLATNPVSIQPLGGPRCATV